MSCRKSKGKPNGKKPAPEEKKLYLEPEYTKSRITDFEFKELVMLPREIDLNEWLASNSEYSDHTALEIAVHTQVGIHSLFFFSLLFSALRKACSDYLCSLHNACHYTLNSN